MENKKTKLTISGSPKKTFKHFDTSKSQGKKTVVIEKQSSKPSNKGNFNKPAGLKSSSNFKRGTPFKSNFPNKTATISSDFERRKLAEQRATKRLKVDQEVNDKKAKQGSKKRKLKLTVSRALSDEIETRERSLASVKRARQKELKNANKEEDKNNQKYRVERAETYHRSRRSDSTTKFATDIASESLKVGNDGF